ncbi:hypothetical protein J4526_05060 [Desulfurococcaceae archaeon MEX13E-LK6-19]|nr:hypothetical protein J4526_05060 [Desulfurococcaceae archaeon MEX13E-LK6-19]
MLYPHKYKRTVKKAAEILRQNKFSNEIEAYEILVKNEDQLELPVTWDLVIDALKIIRSKEEKTRIKIATH